MSEQKYYCIDCKVNEIDKPEYCCDGGSIYGGTACGCMGKPIEPPLCETCYDKFMKKWSGDNE